MPFPTNGGGPHVNVEWRSGAARSAQRERGKTEDTKQGARSGPYYKSQPEAAAKVFPRAQTAADEIVSDLPER